MIKLNRYTWSAMGLVLLLACGSSKSNGLVDGTPSEGTGSTGTSSTDPGTSINIGNKGGAGGVSVSTGTSGTGALGSSGNAATNGGSSSKPGTSGTGSTSTGSNGSVGGSSSVTTSSEGGVGTEDPPPATGGSGQTEDPPPGDTVDPPPGDTVDPPPGDTIDPPPGDTIDPPPGDTIDPPPGDTIDPPPGDTPDPPPGCTMTEIDKVNVIVFNDASPSGADAEGRMWVGHDLIMNGGYSVNATTIAELKSTCNDWALVVGNNISGNPIVASGKAAYGGTFTGAFSGSCGIFHQTPVDFVALEAKFDGYSAAFAAYTTQNSSVVGTAAVSGGYLVLTGTNAALNVFNITADDLKKGGLKFVVPATSSIIVNISGKTISWAGVGFVMPDGSGTCKAGTSSWCHKILYNMYEATSVTMTGIGVQGSVLAPYATVDGGGGNIDGQLICKNLKGGLEYHPYFFSGCLLLPKV
jgi:choice-of-anchor A domain-containing protein